VRIGQHAVLGVDEANTRACLRGSASQLRLLCRSAETLAAREACFQLRAHQHGLVLHIALQSVEQLTLVQPRELEARNRHHDDQQIHDQESRAEAS
jgi:hypothetical protein